MAIALQLCIPIEQPHPSRSPGGSLAHHDRARVKASAIASSAAPKAPAFAHLEPSTYSSHHGLLQSPSWASLAACREAHAQLIVTGQEHVRDELMCELVEAYAALGDFRSSGRLLGLCFEQGFLPWSYLTEGFWVSEGRPCRVLELLREWHRGGEMLRVGKMVVALKVCTYLVAWRTGLEFHALAVKGGADCYVGSKCALMDFYAEFGGVESPEKFVDNEDPLLWNKAVCVDSQNGMWQRALDVFRKMQMAQISADEVTISKVIQACGKLVTLREGMQVHGIVIRLGLSSSLLVNNSLISMYSKNYSVDVARRVFEVMEDPNLVSWNSMIWGYALNGLVDNALKLFEEMTSSNVNPDLVTWNCLISGHVHDGSSNKVFVLFRGMQSVGLKPNSSSITSVLQVISDFAMVQFGKEVHGYTIRHGLEHNVFVGTSIIDMYVKSDNLMVAHKVFDNMSNKNVFAWNSLISGYAFKGLLGEAMGLLNQMENEGTEPDLTTWNSLISGFAMKGLKKQALILIRKLKALGEKPNVISWTALISGFCQKGTYKEALDCFVEMQKEGIEPNSATIASLLRACSGLSLMDKGKEIHSNAVRKGLDRDIFVATALVDMYSKSGSLHFAFQIFKKIKVKSLSSWNAMIMGFAIYGLAQETRSLFDEMCSVGMEPDGITFTALLCSCKNSGLVSEGWRYFDIMQHNYNLPPTPEHYACMVDLLGKAGYLDEAWDLIQTMPAEPDASVWGALLGACKNYNNLLLAEIAAKHLFKLEVHNSTNYLLMMSIYASKKRWQDVDKLKDRMNSLGLKSKASWSWIHIGQTLHVFSVDGKPHPDMGEICYELYNLVLEIKKMGYIPDTSCVAQNVDEGEKEKMLMGHTEKLAITYGLIHTDKPDPIRIIKNSRICKDCHAMARYVSKMSSRQILLKDGARFHHFLDGKCSCGDYW